MNDGAAIGGLLCVVGAVLVGLLIIVIFYLSTLQKALQRVSPRNRLMEPGMVWLLLIPVFGLIWQFFIAIRVPGSLSNEFRSRGQGDGSDYGKGIALGAAITGLVGVVLSNIDRNNVALSLISFPISLATLVLFILFWVKVANYSKQLGTAGYQQSSDDDEDDDDDFDRRPRRRNVD